MKIFHLKEHFKQFKTASYLNLQQQSVIWIHLDLHTVINSTDFINMLRSCFELFV